MEETNRTYTQPALFPDGKDTVAVFPSQIKAAWARIAELEAAILDAAERLERGHEVGVLPFDLRLILGPNKN